MLSTWSAMLGSKHYSRSIGVMISLITVSIDVKPTLVLRFLLMFLSRLVGLSFLIPHTVFLSRGTYHKKPSGTNISI